MLTVNTNIKWYNAKEVRPKLDKHETVWVIYNFGFNGNADVMDVTYKDGLFNGTKSFDDDVLYWAYTLTDKDFGEDF